jgi:VWFA-related protein
VLLGAILGVAPAADLPTFRINSVLVTVPVSVTDSKDKPVTGLGKDAFRLFDRKVEQTVLHFSQQDAPVSVGIVFDTSRSMTGKFANARRAVAEFLHNSNPEDEFFLVDFDSHVQVESPFTSNPDEIERRMATHASQGRTALLDAVYLAIDYMRKASHQRKALLVISDGGDNDSRFTMTDLRRRMREADITVYAMGIYEAGATVVAEEEGAGPQLLSTLAEASGGRHFALFNAGEMPSTAARIAYELRNQYLLEFSPSALDASYHPVEVKVVGQRGVRVTTRPGYRSGQ